MQYPTGPPPAPNSLPEVVGLRLGTSRKADFIRDDSLTQTQTAGSSNPTGKISSREKRVFFPWIEMGAFPLSHMKMSPA